MADSLDRLIHNKTESHPMIYAYSDEQYPNCLKVGYTAVDVDKRVAQQYPTKRPDGSVPYKIVLRESAMYSDGSSFTDHDVHTILKKKGKKCVGGEWYECTASDVKSAIIAVRNHTFNVENRTQTFKLRPEQAEAVNMTADYFKSAYEEGSGRTPKFLWNAKMRFGKTFATYQLAKKMNMKRVLILTFKPAVVSAWREDLMTHIDFEGWQFVSRPDSAGEPSIDEQYKKADKNKPIVCFGSFQDFLGVNKDTGGIKSRNEWVHEINWDMVCFDEYHFGAWGENAKSLFEQDDDTYEKDLSKYDRGNAYDETWLPITTNYYLYLSGTPFRALNSGEFIEEQIYNWTYSDEQRAKENWVGDNNPYASLPRMVMLTYQIPESIQRIAKAGEFDEFDLNVFFSAEGKGKDAHFKYEDYVQKWLDLIRGSYLETSVDELKLGAQKPPMPFSDTRLHNALSHTLWFMPDVASCFAMANLLAQKQNAFYHDYTVNVCAGTGAGVGVSALGPVLESMGDPLKTKTITLSCGKLTTGVTVKPWTGIFMLRNLKSPETYFQSAFRVQSPWEIKGEDGTKEIVKHECYVFDFALDRALKQISDYSCRLSVAESNPEKKVGEFINFLPVLAYDGSTMRQISASEILDMAMAGTSSTLLAKRWESALLVNVDNDTLKKLLANEQAMNALMQIEGFRSLNTDIETIINKSDKVKKAKKEKDSLTSKEKKEISDEEKEFKSMRKKIQEKLIKFATRVPVFMYLTDFREFSLQDVIEQLESDLFKKVTGLDKDDFKLLVSLNVFNEALMNDAVYKFKRYEDSSLSYTGIDKHEGENVGLFSTVISREDYDKLAGQLTDSMVAAPQRADDIPNNPFAFVAEPDEEDEEPALEPKIEKKPINREPIVKANKVEQKPIKIIPELKPKADKKPSNPFVVTNPKIDTSSVKEGVRVRHKAFGIGTVTGFEKNSDIEYIAIKFDGGLDKKFAFQWSFDAGFLTID